MPKNWLRASLKEKFIKKASECTARILNVTSVSARKTSRINPSRRTRTASRLTAISSCLRLKTWGRDVFRCTTKTVAALTIGDVQKPMMQSSQQIKMRKVIRRIQSACSESFDLMLAIHCLEAKAVVQNVLVVFHHLWTVYSQVVNANVFQTKHLYNTYWCNLLYKHEKKILKKQIKRSFNKKKKKLQIQSDRGNIFYLFHFSRNAHVSRKNPFQFLLKYKSKIDCCRLNDHEIILD